MKDGIYTDLSIDDYHGNTTHISSTQVRTARKSLREYLWLRSGLIKTSRKSYFDFGNAFELALMDRIAFENNVVLFDESERPEKEKGITSHKNQDWKKSILNGSKYVIAKDGDESMDTINQMVESCYRDAVIQKLIKNTEYQVSCFWTDEQTGLRLKSRPDICTTKKKVIVNIKTAADGSPQAFSKDLAKHDYPLQACMEITGCLRTGLLEDIDTYLWLVVEKNPPFNATLYDFSKSDIEMGMDELEYVLRKIKRAHEEDLFPGYTDRADNPHGILTAEIPLYYRMMNS